VGAIHPPEDMSDWVSAAGNPDLLVFGLQEIVELSAIGIPGGVLKHEKWIQAFKRALPANYEQVQYIRLIGVFLIVFRRAEAAFTVSDVDTHIVGTGMLNFGNKGGAGISMKLNDFRLCIINSHLAAGQGEVAARNKDFHSIARNMKFSKVRNIYEHDAIIWMGDMNSRLNIAKDRRNEIVHLCNTGAYADLLQHDQLHQQKQERASFADFHEMPPTFKPTYKFDPKTSTYDTGPKQRMPAWCDRVLHWKKNSAVDIAQLTYESRHDVKHSDHKPVQALLRLNLVPR